MLFGLSVCSSPLMDLCFKDYHTIVNSIGIEVRVTIDMRHFFLLKKWRKYTKHVLKISFVYVWRWCSAQPYLSVFWAAVCIICFVLPKKRLLWRCAFSCMTIPYVSGCIRVQECEAMVMGSVFETKGGQDFVAVFYESKSQISYLLLVRLLYMGCCFMLSIAGHSDFYLLFYIMIEECRVLWFAHILWTTSVGDWLYKQSCLSKRKKTEAQWIWKLCFWCIWWWRIQPKKYLAENEDDLIALLGSTS